MERESDAGERLVEGSDCRCKLRRDVVVVHGTPRHRDKAWALGLGISHPFAHAGERKKTGRSSLVGALFSHLEWRARCIVLSKT